jgi:hypothetical protein
VIRSGLLVLLLGVAAGASACGDDDRGGDPILILDDEGNPANTSNSGGSANTGNTSGSGFSGQWSGTLDCTVEEQTSQGTTRQQQSIGAQIQFNANQDLVLHDANGQPQAQTHEGLRVDYVLNGGGVGSRTLASLQRGTSTRRYEYHYSENRTRTDSSSSDTYRRQAVEVYDFTLNGAQLTLRYEIVAEETNRISTESGTINSTARGHLLCNGTLSRT